MLLKNNYGMLHISFIKRVRYLLPSFYENSQVFQSFGTIDEVRTQKDKSFGFVKFQTHDQATRSIISANGTVVSGRPIRVHSFMLSQIFTVPILIIVFNSVLGVKRNRIKPNQVVVLALVPNNL